MKEDAKNLKAYSPTPRSENRTGRRDEQLENLTRGVLGITWKFIKREYEKVGKNLGLAQITREDKIH